jgi:hypothetical protein
MTYADLCKSLGIDREAITKACEEPKNHAVGREREVFMERVGKRVKPTAMEEDLSRFVSKMGQKVAGKLRK